MRVTMYKSSDGELHDSHEKFLKHEAREKIVTDARSIWPRFEVCDDVGEGEPVSINRWIANNADQLRNILNNAMSIKRVKKTVKAPV
jgi:hypothetical protein